MWPFSSRIRRGRLDRWLSGDDEPARVLPLSSMERDDLVWEAYQRFEKGRSEEALVVFDLVLALWPKTGREQALLGKAAALQSLGKLQAADDLYSSHLELFPHSEHARINRAEVRLLLDRKDLAHVDLKHALLALEHSTDGQVLIDRAKRLLASIQDAAAPAARS